MEQLTDSQLYDALVIARLELENGERMLKWLPWLEESESHYRQKREAAKQRVTALEAELERRGLPKSRRA